MTSITVPWFAEIVLISYRTVKKEQRPPLPSELLATFVAFGTFSILGNSQPKIAGLLGWGIVVATFLNLFPESLVPQGEASKVKDAIYKSEPVQVPERLS